MHTQLHVPLQRKIIRNEILNVLLYLRANRAEAIKAYNKNYSNCGIPYLITLRSLRREQRERTYLKASNNQDYLHLLVRDGDVSVDTMQDFIEDLPADSYLDFETYEGDYGEQSTQIRVFVYGAEQDWDYLQRLHLFKEKVEEYIAVNKFKQENNTEEYIRYLENQLRKLQR